MNLNEAFVQPNSRLKLSAESQSPCMPAKILVLYLDREWKKRKFYTCSCYKHNYSLKVTDESNFTLS